MSITNLLNNLSFLTPVGETVLTLSEVDWFQYEKLLEYLNDNNGYRIAYLDGVLEIVSPSENHEIIKKNLAILLERYFEIQEIDFWAVGSTTYKDQDKSIGKEPDECYYIGTKKQVPDLAIEVICTSGGVEILQIYKRLQIPEVWIWKKNKIYVYCFVNGEYVEQKNSLLFPELDISLIERLTLYDNPRLAIKELRQTIIRQ